MRILVTGGTGNVGRATVRRLVNNGHQVRVIGRRAGVEIEGAEYASCDITDFDALQQQVSGMEGIVHLAAIAYPGGSPGQEVFRVNCAGTYNIYQAAADEGIRRISSASSINALGFNYGRVAFPIRYFPIDEEHPTYTTDSYSFSKHVVEDTGDYFWRRDGISSVNLRFPGVYELHPEREERMAEGIERFRQRIEQVHELPEGERQARIQQAIARFDETREDRSRPMSREERLKRRESFGEDRDMGLLYGGFARSNFWASVDARDAAQALEKGLLAYYEGSHALFVNDSHNAAGVESEILVRLFFPEVEARTHPLQGTESLVSINKARSVLGFEPEYSMKRWFG